MNRLILIGNGFDLAHGLKTSYHDFILDYLKNCIKSAFESNKKYFRNDEFEVWYEDLLFIIKGHSKPNLVFSNGKSFLEMLLVKESINDIFKDLKDYNILIDDKKNSFVNLLLNECIVKNWVDIESIYYVELKKCLKQYNKDLDYNGNASTGNLIHLNNQLDFIKKRLEEHLIKIEKENKNTINDLSEIIHHNLNKRNEVSKSDKLLILNFNYTSTPNKYLKATDEIINIHGELNNEKNPIIFGYGDDIDNNYNEIENLNENEFFKHIKSFDYFKTINYQNLLKFIDGINKQEYYREFEVFIMGHSCGLSDRTMLSTIFEHPNCKTVKIFYHKEYNDYRNKTYEISRHFKGKASMRRKIVPFPECNTMPQHYD